MKIILGSQSIGRKSVLDQAGYTVTVMPAHIDEKEIRSDNYHELPLLLARKKAETLSQIIQEPAILIAADTIVICNGELREKPDSPEQARRYLKSYGSYSAKAITGVVIKNTLTKQQVEGQDIAEVFFKQIPEEVIEAAIIEGSIFRAAGGFLIEHPLLIDYIDRIIGEISSVKGLPLTLTEQLMTQVK